jgi:hypothetical protein
VRGGSVPYFPEQGASIETLLRFQSGACGGLGSPLYQDLLARAADDFEAGGPVAAVLAGHEDDPGGSALPLRLMGAVHRLALDGSAPELARRFAAGDGDRERTWLAFRDALEEHGDRLRLLVELPVQTNEVGRCAVLLAGFLEVAASSGLPLRLLEVGASAGLNLRWDAYRYTAAGFRWGPPESPLEIEFEVDGGEMPEPVAAVVAERRGCDAAPIDPASDEGRLTLLSYVWADQTARLARLRAALALAAEVPAVVEEAAAPGWIRARLAEPVAGVATVVYHSVVMQYLTPDERDEFEAAIAAAGAAADQDAPLAWLRMEPAGPRAEVRLTAWPGGEDRRLALAGYHGTPVDLSANEG